ncbi:DUF5683 domain-containing protein [Segatella copri]|mgnify:FL=1|jgi:hypothetical protein|uniref:DUF5683 domain-containing protein n=1 Tax=Segatella copri TaxID=165179 RepID=A0A6G1U560_9BACT|nr:DUF5683 domain-containing protein [Segatella copri]MBV3402513.1 hypothetical protein [Segatella copri]MBW0048363.1 hypothetical protein [Segatella copri]MCW4120009.1 DUF5683 domain-containing protein [Segatella copri]MQN81901.1 hypothetical protein [Segatella copri]
MRLENICITALLLVSSTLSYAQKNREKTDVNVPAIASADSVKMPVDSVLTAQDSSNLAKLNQSLKPVKKKRDWSTWHPEAKRAMWMALVLPGAGQIYNRKYWKLPIIYGGFVGCAYAITWNNQMYHDYSQAYLDIMDDDPNTQSYNQFLHLGATIDASNIDRYKEIFRKRKDKFRRWRDMGVFVMIGVYAFSVIDAYVDASLSEFDISDDLTLRVEPTVMNDKRTNNPFKSASLGLQCSLKF